MHQPWNFESIDTLPARIWTELSAAAGDVAHPWRTPVLSTVTPSGPDARVIVLRSVDPAARTWSCFSDARAPKMKQASEHPECVWVFYDPRTQLQLRARGRVTVHRDDGVSAAAWAGVPEVNAVNYRRRVAPGIKIGTPSEGWETCGDGESQFGVLRFEARAMELLALNPTGHVRARFLWQSEDGIGGWRGTWVAP